MRACKLFQELPIRKLAKLILLYGIAVLLLVYFPVVYESAVRVGIQYKYVDINILPLHYNTSEVDRHIKILRKDTENYSKLTAEMKELILPWWEDDYLYMCYQHVEFSNILNKTSSYYDKTSGSHSAESSMTLQKNREYMDYISKNETGSHCGFRAYQKGDKQSVVSYSLYGNDSIYFQGFPQILNDITELYPHWLVRIYTDPRERKDLLCPLLIKHANLFICDIMNLPFPLGNVSSSNERLWRVAPLGDMQVIRFISRDSDSKVSENIYNVVIIVYTVWPERESALSYYQTNVHYPETHFCVKQSGI